MSLSARAQHPPVNLTDPLSNPPNPVPGCDVCAALRKQWGQATEAGSPAFNPSHASDLAVEIGRHPHGKRRTP
jgi:hypothetical protein